MYAYVASRAGQQNDFYEGAEFDENTREYVNTEVCRPRKLAYWRKHPNLHGWFQQEWENQGNTGSFNGDELEITWDMLDRLESDVREGRLPATQGFFFGDNADAEYYNDDLEFIRNARAEIFSGFKVFYNSSW